MEGCSEVTKGSGTTSGILALLMVGFFFLIFVALPPTITESPEAPTYYILIVVFFVMCVYFLSRGSGTKGNWGG
jgi:hypothetical protein